MNVLHTGDSIRIKEVWNDNIENEFALIRDIVDDFPFVAMDSNRIREVWNDNLDNEFALIREIVNDFPSVAIRIKEVWNDNLDNEFALIREIVDDFPSVAMDSIRIREVWNDDLENEFALIREIVDDFPSVAMDTQFSGVVFHRPLPTSKPFYMVKANVDMLKLIQLSLTFSDEKGNLPTCGTGKLCVWQFKFNEFNINTYCYSRDYIELLIRSGIDFKKNQEEGVDAYRFGEFLMSSEIVLNDNVQWVMFHSVNDFGYMIELLTCQNLPDTLEDFVSLMMKLYFPTLYDVNKLMSRTCPIHQKGSLA